MKELTEAEKFINQISEDKNYKELFQILKETSNSFKSSKLVYAEPQIRLEDGMFARYSWIERQRESKSGRISMAFEFQPIASTVIGGTVTRQQLNNPFQAFTDFLDQSHNIFKSKKDFLDFTKGNFSNISDAETLKNLGKVFYLFASEHLNQLLSEKEEAEKREKSLKATSPESRSQQLLELYPSNAIWKQKDAAALVGMSTRTLYKRMQEGLFKIHKSKVYIKSFLEYLYKNEPQYFNNALEREL